MFKIPIKTIFHKLKNIDLEKREFKVSVIGAAGDVGAPTMMLLKMNPLISELVGIDRKASVLNIARDLSHLNFPAKVSGHMVTSRLDEVLSNSNLVIQTVNSVPVTPQTTVEDMFKGNASHVKALAELAVDVCPDACFLIVTNPINSMVPLFCKVMEGKRKLNPNKVFGMSNLGSITASSYIAELKGLDPRHVRCPVIGGYSSTTTVPVLSMATPKIGYTMELMQILAQYIQKGNSNLFELKSPSSTMATAYATASLADSILKGLKGDAQISDYAFVKSNVCGTKYFASPLIFGKGGIEKNLGLPKLNKFEQHLLEVCISDLSKEVERGEHLIGQ